MMAARCLSLRSRSAVMRSVISSAERALKELHLAAIIDNAKVKAEVKIAELRGKSDLGGYSDYSAYLAEWYRKTAEHLYALMLGVVNYETMQALTLKHCMHGASTSENFIILIGVWTSRANRSDVHHVALLWSKANFLTPVRGKFTVDGFLSNVEIIKSAAAAFPLDENQKWVCLHWLVLERTPATYSMLQKWGAMAISSITDQSQHQFITETRQISPSPTMSMASIYGFQLKDAAHERASPRAETRTADALAVTDVKPGSECFNCGRPGHWAKDCDKPIKDRNNPTAQNGGGRGFNSNGN